MLHTTELTLYLDDQPLLTLPPLTVAPGEVLTLMGPSGCSPPWRPRRGASACCFRTICCLPI